MVVTLVGLSQSWLAKMKESGIGVTPMQVATVGEVVISTRIYTIRDISVQTFFAGCWGTRHRQGCFLHRTQNTWRKVQDLGLVRQYSVDAAARHFCGMLDGLAFLPIAEVAAGMALPGGSPQMSLSTWSIISTPHTM